MRKDRPLCPSCGRHFVTSDRISGFCAECDAEHGRIKQRSLDRYMLRHGLREKKSRIGYVYRCTETEKEYLGAYAAAKDMGLKAENITQSAMNGWAVSGYHFTRRAI